MKRNLMYRENKKSINAFVGCIHQCVYCIPSFQRQAKRRKKFCRLCYEYIPHFHPERLQKAPPKTYGEEFIFFPSMGDLAFAFPQVIKAHIEYAKKYSDRMFLIQSKNPMWFRDWDFPKNVILGTTIETNRYFFSTPSKYRCYKEISKAPIPIQRFRAMISFNHPTKMVTIEPILQFDISVILKWLTFIRDTTNKLIVYVGYDNHNVKLPEPKIKDTLKLINQLKEYDFVTRLKNIRRAWYE